MMNLFTDKGNIKDMITIHSEYMASICAHFEISQHRKRGKFSTSNILLSTPRKTPKYEEPKKPVKKKNLPKQFLPKPAYKGAR